MGKRQLVPDMERDNDSTESCDENQNETACPHIVKSVDFNKVKKITKPGFFGECRQCENYDFNYMSELDGPNYEYSLWLCLRCGNQGCSRTQQQHALIHYNTPSSDRHSLSMNTRTFSVWCYDCDTMVQSNSKKKLLETIEWLKKHLAPIVHNDTKKTPIPIGYYPLTNLESGIDVNIVPTNVKMNLPRARGLTNLGNTCFFNAVIQCLGHTPFLQSLLLEMSSEGETFSLPGGNIQINNIEEPTVLLPLAGILSGWGTLTRILYNTLKELTSGRADVYSPRDLLSDLTHRHPTLGGGEQHDSHELLRHLLEMVRTEDLKRYQLIILEKLGLTRKTQPDTVEGCTKTILKYYGQQASDLMIRTDQIFQGILVSTLQCQDCKHSSHREEFFLDLSLPVSVDKHIPPSLRRKTDIEMQEPEKPSKYKLKKEKRAAHKTRKHQTKHQANSAAANNIIRDEQKHARKSHSDESDGSADIEDNLEESKGSRHTEEPNIGLESGYNSDKISDVSPELNTQSIDPATNDVQLKLPSPQFPSEDLNDYERPISRLSFSESSSRITEDKSTESELTGSFCNRFCDTISARYQCEEGECSVQSCLNQFTACELMTGNNKVRCENCTKNINGAGGKGIDTNATKQLLIYSPPAILILHLKRFQVSRCFPRKMGKHVSFPLILDLAPFCSNRCRGLSTVSDQQTRLLYSLYGIVEHSGNMHSGHYIAYVKVRPDLPEDHYRYQFLSRRSVRNNKLQNNDIGAESDPIPPQGKWYLISDSHVSEVSESQVLRAQAYLLFYERFL